MEKRAACSVALPVVSTYCSLKNTMERDTVINIQCRRHSTLLRCHDTLCQYSIQDVSTSRYSSTERTTLYWHTKSTKKFSLQKSQWCKKSSTPPTSLTKSTITHSPWMRGGCACQREDGRWRDVGETSNSVVMSSQEREFLDVHVPEFRTWNSTNKIYQAFERSIVYERTQGDVPDCTLTPREEHFKMQINTRSKYVWESTKIMVL